MDQKKKRLRMKWKLDERGQLVARWKLKARKPKKRKPQG